MKISPLNFPPINVTIPGNDGYKFHFEGRVTSITQGHVIASGLADFIDVPINWGAGSISGAERNFDIPFINFGDFNIKVDSINSDNIINAIPGFTHEQKAKLESIITEQKELTNKTPQEATKNLAGMTLGELVLYQRYISEFQKSKSEKAIESMNKALNIINNTPEGLTLIDANKYPYDKKHTTNVGIIELTSRVMINSQKNLNNFLNNEIKKSDDFWNEIGNKYQRAVRNLFLYYREMKAKLSRALTTEVARLKRIKEDLEKSRIEINEAIHDGQNTAIPPSVKQLIFAKLYPKEALEIGLFSKGSTNITTNAVRFATQGDEKKGTFTQPKEMQGEGTQVNAFRHMIWQATLAARYGEKIAKHAGDAHEVDPRVDLNIRQFAVLNDADQTIDLLNNQIGRHIGLNSNTTSMKTLALIALEKFHKEGLYVAVKNAHGYEVVKEKISNVQYAYMKSVFESLDENGK